MLKNLTVQHTSAAESSYIENNLCTYIKVILSLANDNDMIQLVSS